MAKTAKSTKKFNKKHLKATIQKRQDAKKFKKKPKTPGSATGAIQSKDDEDSLLLHKDLAKEGGKAKKQMATVVTGKKHKKELEGLAERDPEFFKYLKDNDAELLDFSASDGDGEEEEENDDDDDEGSDEENSMEQFDHEDEEEFSDEELNKVEEEEDSDLGSFDESGEDSSEEMSKASKSKEKKPDVLVTKEILETWCNDMEKDKSLQAVKKALIAIRTTLITAKDTAAAAQVYKIENDKIFNKAISALLQLIPDTLNHHFNIKNEEKKPLSLLQHTKWKKLKPLVRGYIESVVSIFEQQTDPLMLQLALQESSIRIIPYLSCFKKWTRLYIKEVIRLWSNGPTDPVKLQALVHLRAFALYSPTFLDSIFKGVYATFVQLSKVNTPLTINGIQFMINSMAEIYSLDDKKAYEHAFLYIRQMAIHLRNALQAKTKEAYKSVCNWQFVNCLDFWSTFLAKSQLDAKHASLSPLVYPLTQVAFGASRLVNASWFIPFKLHCVKSLMQLCRNSSNSMYIPLAAILMEIFEMPEMVNRSKNTKDAGMLKSLDFKFEIKCPNTHLQTKIYQEGVYEQTTRLLMEYFSIYSRSISFPEFVIPVTITLRRILKQIKNAKSSRLVQQLLEKIEQNAKFIEGLRSQVEFSPSEIEKTGQFEQGIELTSTPLGKYWKSVMETEVKRDAMLAEATTTAESKPEPSERKKKRGREVRKK